MKKRLIASVLVVIILFTTVLCNNVIRAGVTEITGGSGVTINTIVRKNYTDVNVTGKIELIYGQEYVIDFTKDDNLSKGLKALSKTNEVVYYNIVDGIFIETENIEEAVVKIEGKENRAIMTSLYNGTVKKYTINFTKTVYDGAKLTYESATVTSPAPTITPSEEPATSPAPTITPSEAPATSPAPTITPSEAPVTSPAPTITPSETPATSLAPTITPSEAPVTSPAPTIAPTIAPSEAPSETLSAQVVVPLVASTETQIVTNSTTITEIRDEYYTNYRYDFTFVCGTFPIYSFIDGQNQVYTIGKSHNLTFRIDADYSLFNEQVYVDNELVDVSNYTSKSGSTIVTFKDEFLNKLAVGKHNLKIKFADSGVAETQFAVVSLNNTKITSNPQTGDNIFVYGTIMTISIIGIISTYVINRKKFNNK